MPKSSVVNTWIVIYVRKQEQLLPTRAEKDRARLPKCRMANELDRLYSKVEVRCNKRVTGSYA